MTQKNFSSMFPALLFIGLLFRCSAVMAVTDSSPPEQIHISVGESNDQMIIVWSTFSATNDSTVQYGQSSMDQKAVGSSVEFISPGTERRAQFIHRVVLHGLKPKTFYYYRVGSAVQQSWSDVLKFRTWPEGDDWAPSLAIYGDLGVANPQSLKRLIDDTEEGSYDGILHVGDLAYNLYTDNGRNGDAFMREIQPLASQIPYMTCPGNHEERYNFTHYRHRLSMPGDDEKKTYYSFNMGPVHFISISTELIFFPNYGLTQIVDQYLWLEKELAEANKPENRKKHPWVIVFGHRPMYCSNDDKDDCTKHESITRVGIPFLHVFGMETLYYKYGVDVALWAHEHSYERLWPVYDRKVYNGSYKYPYTNPGAPVHIITGSAGCGAKHDPFDKNVDDWSAFRIEDYGYMRMKVFNSTHLYMEQVSDDKHGAVVDSLMVIKDKHGPYHPNPKPVKPVGDHSKKQGPIWKPYIDEMQRLLSKL